MDLKVFHTEGEQVMLGSDGCSHFRGTIKKIKSFEADYFLTKDRPIQQISATK